MLLCENGTVCPFFMSVCHLYTGLLFSVSQISVVKIFYLGNEYICGFVYEKGNRKSYLQSESGTIRHSYSVLMPV